MKIGIDTLGCNHSQSGQGSYLLYFLSNLPEDKDYQFELFGNEVDRYVYTTDNGLKFSSVIVKDNIKSEKKWHKHKAWKFYKKNKYDLVIYPAAELMLPKKFKIPGIAVLNSSVSKISENLSRKEKRNLKKGLSNVQHIIAGSEYIKNDLIENGFESDKITVILNGIDHKMFFPSIDLDSDYVDVKPFSIKRPYFVYGSRLSDAGKKHIELIKAFELLKQRTNYPHRLVIAGSEGDYSDIIHDAVYKSPAASDILITGYFPHESFSKLYAGATACVFPAVNDGTGLSIIEAMACGIPVLCSSAGALPEIGGSIPLYFDSDNIEEIADIMQKVIEDDEIYKNKSVAGLEWAKKYNWEAAVKKTLDVAKNIKK